MCVFIADLFDVMSETLLDEGDLAGTEFIAELAPVRALPRPVTLADIKATPALADMREASVPPAFRIATRVDARAE